MPAVGGEADWCTEAKRLHPVRVTGSGGQVRQVRPGSRQEQALRVGQRAVPRVPGQTLPEPLGIAPASRGDNARHALLEDDAAISARNNDDMLRAFL